MKAIFTKNMSRLRKKLLLYFLLISIVSISVSAEIILEVSSPVFSHRIENNFYNQLKKDMPEEKAKLFMASLNEEAVFDPIYNLRNRTILLLMVIFVTIIGALFLFTKDIVDPLDVMVTATKKIVDGDLTVKVPVITADEIGQIAGLINDLNEMFFNMIIQIKNDLNRHKNNIAIAARLLNKINDDDSPGKSIYPAELNGSNGKSAAKISIEVISLLEDVLGDLTSLQNFMSKYKIYSLKSELSQEEIEKALKNYKL